MYCILLINYLLDLVLQIQQPTRDLKTLGLWNVAIWKYRIDNGEPRQIQIINVKCLVHVSKIVTVIQCLKGRHSRDLAAPSWHSILEPCAGAIQCHILHSQTFSRNLPCATCYVAEPPSQISSELHQHFSSYLQSIKGSSPLLTSY